MLVSMTFQLAKMFYRKIKRFEYLSLGSELEKQTSADSDLIYSKDCTFYKHHNTKNLLDVVSFQKKWFTRV